MAVTVSLQKFKLLAPLLYLSRIFGLMPLKWHKNGYTCVISKSPLYIWCSYGGTLFLIFSSINGLVQTYKQEIAYSIRFKSHTERLVTLCDISVVLLPGIFGAVITSLKIDKHLEYLSCLNRADAFLQYPKESRTVPLLVTIMTMTITSTILIFDMFLWMKLSANQHSVLILITNYLPYYLCYCFSVVLELLYFHLVYLIKVRLECLNERLANLQWRQRDTLPFIGRKQIGGVVDTLVPPPILNTESAIKIGHLQDLIGAYVELSEATNKINDCYGFLILIVILGCLTHLLSTPYALYSMILNTRDNIFLVSQSIWMMGHILRLLLIVEPCHACVVQWKIALELVCKLVCGDSNAKKELNVFVVLVSHCQIEFNAYGLAKINHSLLATITGTVTTYLVILFQFKTTE